MIHRTEVNMATFFCLNCNTIRPYGYACSDPEFHPRLHCLSCHTTTLHAYQAHDDYLCEAKLSGYGTGDNRITEVVFTKQLTLDKGAWRKPEQGVAK